MGNRYIIKFRESEGDKLSERRWKVDTLDEAHALCEEITANGFWCETIVTDELDEAIEKANGG